MSRSSIWSFAKDSRTFELRTYYAKDPDGARTMDRIERLTDEKLSEMATTLRLYEQGSPEGWRELILTDKADMILTSSTPETTNPVADVCEALAELPCLAPLESLKNDVHVISGIDNPNARIVLLDPSKDGIKQMADVLKQYKSVDAVHIISHGSEGQLDLGSSALNSTTMSSPSSACWRGRSCSGRPRPSAGASCRTPRAAS